MTPRRIALGAFGSFVAVQAAVYEPPALPSIIAAGLAVAAVVVVEEIRVREARRDAREARARRCPHGATDFMPSAEDGAERDQIGSGRQRR